MKRGHEDARLHLGPWQPMTGAPGHRYDEQDERRNAMAQQRTVDDSVKTARAWLLDPRASDEQKALAREMLAVVGESRLVDEADHVARHMAARRPAATAPGKPRLVIGSGDREAARTYLARLGSARAAGMGHVEAARFAQGR